MLSYDMQRLQQAGKVLKPVLGTMRRTARNEALKTSH